MSARILFVDDDVNILSGFQRNLRNRFSVLTADSGDKALKILSEDSSIAVVVSDFRMPGMNGVEFLSKTAADWPECVRVLLTGEADTRAAAAAVNQGQIFRFLSKPCPVFTLEKTLNEAVKQHELITSEKVLLERTLRGTVEVLSEILSILHPAVFSRSDRVSRIVKIILQSINISSKWEFEIAAMLCDIGCIALPLHLIEKVCQGQDLSAGELSIYSSYPATGGRMLEKIPRLELVAQIISQQGRPVDPIPAWQEVEKVERLPLGCYLLQLAIDMERSLSKRCDKVILLADFRARVPHPLVFKGLEQALDKMKGGDFRRQTISTRELQPGMIVDADLVGEHGLLLLAKDQFLSDTLIQYLQRRLQFLGTEEMISVRVAV